MVKRRVGVKGTALTRDEILFLKRKYTQRGLSLYETIGIIDKIKKHLRERLKQAREQGKSKEEQNLIFAQEFEKIVMDAEGRGFDE
jgi:hypothetical protein|tara:strand:- start:4590 stop:4847 length:258 start_codon:yes stop_codon:yes gene_type:complete